MECRGFRAEITELVATFPRRSRRKIVRIAAGDVSIIMAQSAMVTRPGPNILSNE